MVKQAAIPATTAESKVCACVNVGDIRHQRFVRLTVDQKRRTSLYRLQVLLVLLSSKCDDGEI